MAGSVNPCIRIVKLRTNLIILAGHKWVYSDTFYETLLKPILKFAVILFLASMTRTVHAQANRDHYEQGLRYLQLSKVEKGFESFLTAAILSEKNGDWPFYYLALAKIGEHGYELAGDAEVRAFNQLKTGLKQVNQVPNDSLGQFYLCLGNLYRDLTTEADSAILWLEKARVIFQGQHGENNDRVAQCYAWLGWVNRYQRFDLLEAQRCFEKSLAIWEQLKGDHDVELIRNYYNLAVTFRAQGELEKSISYGTQALKLAQRLNKLEFEGVCHSLFGTIYMDMDSLSLATRELELAIAINIKLKHNRGDLIRYYSNLGLICERWGKTDRSREYFNKSIEIAQEDNVDQYARFGGVNAWLMIAGQMLKDHDYSAAFSALKKARHQFVALVGDQSEEDAQLLFSFSEYFLGTNQLDSALSYVQRALRAGIREFRPANDLYNPSMALLKDTYYVSSSSFKNNLYLHDVIFRKAEILRAQYRANHLPKYLYASLECFALTEELLTRSRKTFDFDQAKWRTADAYFKVYETPIEMLQEIYSRNKSDSIQALLFQYMEKSKSNTLRDALVVAESYKKNNLPDSIILSLGALQERQRSIQHEIDEAVLDVEGNADRISSLRLLITDIDKRLKDIRDFVKAKYPDYYRIKYSNSVASLADVRRYSTENGVDLLEFFYGKNHVYGMMISGSKIEFRELAESDSITGLINAFSDHFNTTKKSEISRLNRFQNFVKNSSALYQVLLSPFGLSQTDKLLIVPDGLLATIPFEALLTRNTSPIDVNYRSLPYLINSNDVSYAFFATSLFRRLEEVSGSRLLALAYSAHDNNAGVERKDARSIPGTSIELDAIKAVLASGVFLRDTNATEGRFKNLAKDFDLLHLALHGYGDDKNANMSYLSFPNSGTDNANDGRLYAYELYSLNLKARLAVLSACETGLGRAIKGEGMFSMANAFAYSGCPNVIMSLWKVNDRTTAGIFSQFYQNFANGNTIDGALTQAKRTFIENADEFTADPALWASFVPVGDMQYKMKTPLSISAIVLISLGGVLVLVIGVVFFLRLR
jgi:CHAT domain-containing protein